MRSKVHGEVVVLMVMMSGFLVAAAPPAEDVRKAPPATPEDAKLDDFFRGYLDTLFAAEPMTATRKGDHRFDAKLDDLSAEGRAARVERARKALADLEKAVTYEKLSRDAQIDFEVLRHDLKRQIWTAEKIKAFETDPRAWGEFLTESVYMLLTQSSLPREKNLENAVARMAEVPRVIAQARQALESAKPHKVKTETAIRQTEGAVGFYEKELYLLAGKTPGQDKTLDTRAQAIVKDLKAYVKFLKETVLPQSVENWRVGPELFAEKLELDLDAGLTAAEVKAEAEAEAARVERELYVIARQMWGTAYPNRPLPPDDAEGRRATIRAALAAAANNHGSPETLVADARKTVTRIKAFIKERDILRLPEPDACKILEMPEFMRGNSVAYLNPAPPLDPKANSEYAISPPPSDWSEARVASFLEEYNASMLQILTIHEAYPGHYVQLEYTNRHPSPIRKVLGSGVFEEGWAVYTEQVMLDQGYGKGDLALRLNQLKFYLRAVVNAILDHEMHAGKMTDAQALDLLMNRAFQTEGEAVGKILRSKLSSAQLSTYFVGRTAFYRLRQSIQRAAGDNFVLGRYHEAVLAHGDLPVKYLPELVGRSLGVNVKLAK